LTAAAAGTGVAMAGAIALAAIAAGADRTPTVATHPLPISTTFPSNKGKGASNHSQETPAGAGEMIRARVYGRRTKGQGCHVEIGPPANPSTVRELLRNVNGGPAAFPGRPTTRATQFLEQPASSSSSYWGWWAIAGTTKTLA